MCEYRFECRTNLSVIKSTFIEILSIFALRRPTLSVECRVSPNLVSRDCPRGVGHDELVALQQLIQANDSGITDGTVGQMGQLVRRVDQSVRVGDSNLTVLVFCKGRRDGGGAGCKVPTQTLLRNCNLLHPFPPPAHPTLWQLWQTLRLPLELFKRCATAPNDTKAARVAAGGLGAHLNLFPSPLFLLLLLPLVLCLLL